MRILITTGIFPPDIGGPASYGESLADLLSQKGHKVLVVTFSDSNANHNVNEKYPVKRVLRRQNLFKKYGQFLFLAWKGARQSDVVYCQGAAGSGLIGAIAAIISGKPYLVKIVGDSSWEFARNKGLTNLSIEEFQKRKPGNLLVKARRIAQKLVCLFSRQVIVPSNYLKSIVQQWQVPPQKIKVIKNAVLPLPPTKQKKSDLIKGDPLLVSVGRLVSWKGFGSLIKLMPQVLKKHPGAKLVIIGEGPEYEHLKQQISSLCLDNKVILTGKLSRAEVNTYLQTANVFVLNTYYEGLPHVVLEAMAAGAPIITTRAGGNIEVIEEGVNGLLVEPGDNNQLINKILSVLDNRDLASKLSRGAKKKAEQFDYQRMIKKTIDSIVNAIRKKRVVALHDTPDAGLLEKKIIWLKQNYNIVTPDIFFNNKEDNNFLLNGKKPLLLITLDDGYENWFSAAVPVFKKHNVPAVFFVCSGFLGKSRIPVRQQYFRPLSLSQLKQIADHPLFEIGSHTKTHLNLADVVDNYQLQEEIIGDKRALESVIGKTIRYFAYPFGRSPRPFERAYNANPKVQAVVEQAGFEAAFSLVPGFYYPQTSPWHIPRNSLSLTASDKDWQRRLNGKYDWLLKLKAKVIG